MAYVYIHRKETDNAPFYVGIGGCNSSDDYKRAYYTKRRNNLWKKIYNKYGLQVEISHTDVCWEEACAIEQYLIQFYGRINSKDRVGVLSNLTDGGEGIKGLMFTDLHRGKLSKAKKGNRLQGDALAVAVKTLSLNRHKAVAASKTDDAINKRREKLIGRKASQDTKDKMSESQKRKVFTIEHRKNISLSGLGIKKPIGFGDRASNRLKGVYTGGKNFNAKKVIDTATGNIYDCISDAAKVVGITPANLSNKLKGRTKNKSGFEFIKN